MATEKKSRITTILSAILMGIMLVCSSFAMVFAYEGDVPSVGNTKTDKEIVAESGVDPNGFFDLLEINPNQLAERKTALVDLAKLKIATSNKYSESYLAENFKESSVREVNAILKDVYENVLIVTEDLALSSSWKAEEKRIYDLFAEKEKAILSLSSKDQEDFNNFRAECEKEVVTEYTNLRKVNDENPNGSAKTVVGFYSADQLRELVSVYNEYMEDNHFKGDFTYVPSKDEELRASLKEYKENAIKALKAVHRNEMDKAIAVYLDYIEAENSKDETAIESAASRLVAVAPSAIEFYQQASADVKLQGGYSSYYISLVEFMKEPPEVAIKKISSLSADDDTIQITAIYKDDGTQAEIFPDNFKLTVYQSANGAAKRNARNKIKSYNGDLSVAYFMYITIGSDYKTLDKLDTKDKASGREVEYEVTVDLAKYVANYCEKSGIEKDKTENVNSAFQFINENKDKNEDLSLCYSYKSGEVDKIDCTFEGGKIVFTTQSLNNICVAGKGLESLITNPIFWVIVVVVLILLLVIVRIIVKNVRYSVKFITNGGTPVDKVKAAKNEYFVMPASPTKPGFVFAGWFTDKELKNRFIETCMRKRKSIKLYAKWASPVTKDRLIEMYEILRDRMRVYKKESFKALMGLNETELVASMFLKENHIQLNLSLPVDEAKKSGVDFVLSKDKKFAEVPVQLSISTEAIFENALKLVDATFLAKGLQKQEQYVPCKPLTAEERKNGFAYFIHNERVAKTAEDYFELLRIAIKSYVLEEESKEFKPGDKVTLARIYITNEVACLHLPVVKGEKNLSKASRDATFSDTPVVFRILTSRDMVEAYAMIHKVMTSKGFVRCPENANNLADVRLPATNGFAYTLKF